MSIEKGKKSVLIYDYDFSRDGGEVETKELSPAAGQGIATALEENFVITDLSVHVKKALASSGSPTVTLGDGSDPDGYLADFFSLAGSDDSMINLGEVAGALLWDDTNDHRLHHRIGSADNDKKLQLDIGTAALTAGIMRVYLIGYRALD